MHPGGRVGGDGELHADRKLALEHTQRDGLAFLLEVNRLGERHLGRGHGRDGLHGDGNGDEIRVARLVGVHVEPLGQPDADGHSGRPARLDVHRRRRHRQLGHAGTPGRGLGRKYGDA